ncbi:MAG: GNAT family N-acetyltransferase [Chloroflexota bacterium]|nr:GNAT family N-acetyltransferase [Chloroflexota bacterium]
MIKIREMQSSDAEAMLRLRRAWLSQVSESSETTELERVWFARYPGNGMAPALVAEEGDQIVGYLLCALTTHPTAVGTSAEIDEVCVAESHRRHGIGRRLVQELRRQLLSSVDDLTTIQARTDRKNDSAQAFLHALGFEHDVLEFTDYLE